MKKLNLFVMSLLATAAFTFNSCSNDDTMTPGGSQQETVDNFYMTLQVKGSSHVETRTSQDNVTTENGTTAESTITNGTIYIYDGTRLIFKKNVGISDWTTAPTQTEAGVTKPIKVSVKRVDPKTPYNVYFLANAQLDDPLTADLAFQSSTIGGAEQAQNNLFVMFNENDKTKPSNHSTVTFEEANKNEATPAVASEISLDRVVARVDAPTVNVDKIKKTEATTTENYEDLLEGVTYMSYAISNLNKNSYVVQNWNTAEWTLKTLLTGEKPYYKPYSDYGTQYEAKGLSNFTTNEATAKSYLFENSTDNINNATALYFCIKASLKESAKANADFTDGTFYRYDHRVYTSIQELMVDNHISHPFGENAKPADILAQIKGADGNLIEEGATLAQFRKDYKIEIYRAGMMYYRYAINDNYYTRTDYYSVLRNSIYRLNVNAIYDLGKDVPNGPTPPELDANYYMNVTVAVNPWVLNTKDIQLGN